MFWAIVLPIFRSTRLCVTACGIMHPRCCWLATLWVHYIRSCNTQPSTPEDGQTNCPKRVELTGIINKTLLLHLVGCLYYLYRWCTVKQISDNEIYLLIKYTKSVLWRLAKCLSYIEVARCLKFNKESMFSAAWSQSIPFNYGILEYVNQLDLHEFDIHVTVHRDIYLKIKPTRCTNFSNLFLEWNSTCFGQFLCPLSEVFHPTPCNGTCHTNFLTDCEQDQDGTSWFCTQAVRKPLWHVPLEGVEWETPDDGQRNCPKHVEFHSKTKFHKLVHPVDFILRNRFTRFKEIVNYCVWNC